jgi:DNA-binding response OmpR family regulator
MQLPESAPSIRVLYVDDDPDCLAAVARALVCSGFAVRCVGSPADAEAQLAGSEFDVLLSDIHMPGNTRLEWIQRVLGSGQSPPVVLMTGNPDLETAVSAANSPVAAYLLKPPDASELVATLRRVAVQKFRQAELQAVAAEIARLVRTDATGIEPAAELAAQLLGLSKLLSAAAHTSPRESLALAGGPWRAAIEDTIEVLDQTKHQFRSRELGALRLRLRAMLAPEARKKPAAMPMHASSLTANEFVLAVKNH